MDIGAEAGAGAVPFASARCDRPGRGVVRLALHAWSVEGAGKGSDGGAVTFLDCGEARALVREIEAAIRQATPRDPARS